MAQRMESIAPPGGVMLSESTAHLVRDTTILGEPETVRVKGGQVMLARQLLGIVSERDWAGRTQSTLVGREREVHTVSGILDRAISGRGSVVGVGDRRASERADSCLKRSILPRPVVQRSFQRTANPTPVRSRFTQSRGCCVLTPGFAVSPTMPREHA